MSFQVAIASLAYVWWGDEAVARLRDAGCDICGTADIVEEPVPREQHLAILEQADAVIAGIEPYDAALLAERPRLKLIVRWGAGYDSIDLAAATAAGVLVARTAGGLTDAVADQTFALILAVARRIPAADACLRDRAWRRFQGVAVAGQTLGLVGCGPIGQAVARRAAGFSMRLLVADPYVADALLAELGAQRVPLELLLRESDFVSLHCATTPETRGMINADSLAVMKPNAVLINTARGALVDETALCDALEQGRIAGAGLDTFAVEPPAADAPILSAPNTVLTPHSAFCTAQSILRVTDEVAERILAVAAGRPPDELLNPEVLTSPRRRAALHGV